MSVQTRDLAIEADAPIRTWFGVGGRADRLAHPSDVDELSTCIQMEPNLRILGDGANLLVDDAGVEELVVALDRPALKRIRIDPDSGRALAMAGASLQRLVSLCARAGLGGLEGLVGIPATLGGAVVMNAGGAFGQIADRLVCVDGLDRDGRRVQIQRDRIDFGYRRSGLGDLIVTAAEFHLEPGDPGVLRERLKTTMAYKKRSQPMAERSCGCVFRNPTLDRTIDGIGRADRRVSAGLLIDRAGCKGLSIGGVCVSDRHANFFVTSPGARAGDVLALIDAVRGRVFGAFGVELETEVVVWRRR